ncbi:hypothetical protein NPIL_621601 [Nephila pilipes]|uniref:Uncharacterized protein n=1 Tax=Nephila pilipes TaxID=299642 RepID=A0A8X6R1C4_NEPPI|nr:hypothetical protein NPIL_621601 [Nephila pilipes]
MCGSRLLQRHVGLNRKAALKSKSEAACLKGGCEQRYTAAAKRRFGRAICSANGWQKRSGQKVVFSGSVAAAKSYLQNIWKRRDLNCYY